MFNTLLQKMSIKGSSIYGIELNLGGGKSRYWTLAQLTLGKSEEVKIIRQEHFEEMFGVEQLVKVNLKKNIPIALCITGTGILTSELGEGDNVNSLFPGLDESEVYYKEYEASSFRYASIIRKDALAKLIESLTDHGFFVWNVALGHLSILSILPLLRVQKQEFQLDTYSIQLSPIAIEKNENEILALPERCFIGSEQATVTMLPALAAAIGFYVDHEVPNDAILKNQQKEFKAFKKAKLVGYSFLGLLLAVLFVNFMLYSKYTRQLEDLQLALNEKQQQEIQLNTLKKDLAEKKSILATMGIQRDVPLSYIADRFAACIPKGIKLDKLEINPPTDKIKDRKPIPFTEGRLRVEGVCNNPDDLSMLLECLKKEEWLTKVEKKEYRENDLKGRFILEVSYE